MLFEIATLLDRTMGGVHALVVLFLWTPIQSALMVAVHEAGHALAALVRRQPGVQVSMGTGQTVVMEMRLRAVKLRLSNPALLRVGSGKVEWDAERTTMLDLLVIAIAGPAASLLGGLASWWLAHRFAWGSELYDFFALLGLHMILWGCLLNLIPFTLTQGTRKRPGLAMRTDGGIVLDLLRLGAARPDRA